MARPNEPDMPPKRTKKVRLGIHRTQIQPKIVTRAESVIRTVELASDWLITNLGTVNRGIEPNYFIQVLKFPLKLKGKTKEADRRYCRHY